MSFAKNDCRVYTSQPYFRNATSLEASTAVEQSTRLLLDRSEKEGIRNHNRIINNFKLVVIWLE